MSKFLAIILVFVFTCAVVNALTCYECRDCPTKVDKHKHKVCDAHHSHCMTHTYKGRIFIKLCLKLNLSLLFLIFIKKLEHGKEKTDRDCVDEKYCSAQHGTENVKCELCNKDKCNGAFGVASSASITFFSLIIGVYLARM